MIATAATIAPTAPIRRQVRRVSICAKSAFVARCSYAPSKRDMRSVSVFVSLSVVITGCYPWI